MIALRIGRRCAAAGAACAFLASPAAAATLDWNDPPWPDPATRSFTYTVSKPGGPGGNTMDVTVDITDVNGTLQAGGTGSPSVSTAADLNPPSAGGAPSLFLKADGNAGTGGMAFRAHTGGAGEILHVAGRDSLGASDICAVVHAEEALV